MTLDPLAAISGPMGIFADDLTGAGDTSLQFHGPGRDTWIVPELTAETRVPVGFATLAINTESRHRLPAEAAVAVDKALRYLQRAGCTRFYKKIDSTLRGNVGAEIIQALHTLRHELAIVAPAFPQASRLTVGGYQLVDGLPVNASPYARDPLSPVKHAHLPTLLEEELGEPVAHVGLKEVMGGAEAVAGAIVRAVSERKRVLVADAARPEDLNAIARAMAITPYRVLPVGSAGLARAIAQPHHLLAGTTPEYLRPGPPVLVVAGSLNPVTIAQVARLATHAERIVVDAPALLLGERTALNRLVARVLPPLLSGRDVVITTGATEDALRQVGALGRDLGMGAIQTGAQLVAAMGALVAAVVGDVRLSGLVLAGGETALGVCRALGAPPMRVVDELLPAMPLLRVELPSGPLKVATKSGGFGDPEALVSLVARLRRPENC
jgi:uncharacterized protein YgbK (DUF1537 family)